MSRIDIHHHVQSPFFTEAMERASCPCNVSNFDLASSRSLCEEMGIRTAILSHTAPGPEIEKDPVQAAALARRFNEYSAGIRDQEPQHYGFFASLPSLHDVSACLTEIAFAFDVLDADGVVLMTSYSSPVAEAGPGKEGDGASRCSYLGDPAFAPVWQELNRRRAVVLVHPTYTDTLVHASGSLPVTMLDFPHETARAAMDLVMSNTLRGCARECRIILSHGGGTLASVVDRVALLADAGGKKSAAQIREEVGWFYFDTALCSAQQVQAVNSMTQKGHVMYGSDLPNAPADAVRVFGQAINGETGVTDEDKTWIDANAARILFPRLSA